jgi:hypothetical protein
LAKKFLYFSIKLLLSLLLTLALIEVGLHLFPGLIPLQLLIYFHEIPRAEIARSQNLSNTWDVIYLERDDSGPPLWIYRPLATVRWPVKEKDAVNTRVMDDVGFCNPPANSYHLSTIDLIVLGDSFTTCYAVNPQDTWSSQLATLAGRSAYNLGRIGLGLDSELQIFKQFGLSKSPRVVILNVYEGNDLRDALAEEAYRQKHPQAALLPETFNRELAAEGVLGRYSYSFNLLQAVIQWQVSLATASAT